MEPCWKINLKAYMSRCPRKIKSGTARFGICSQVHLEKVHAEKSVAQNVRGCYMHNQYLRGKLSARQFSLITPSGGGGSVGADGGSFSSWDSDATFSA